MRSSAEYLMMKNMGIKRFLKALVVCTIAVLGSSALYGQGELMHAEYPDSYTVTEGDTLWNIASQFLQNPERWEEIWDPDAYLDNADFIYPGDVLRVRLIDGSPKILVQRGDRAEVRLGPEIRVQPLVSTIPEIPLEDIENSFTSNRIVEPAMFAEAPYIVANLGDNLVIGTGDEVYVRGSWPEGTSSFEVYRAGQLYRDDSGVQVLGQEIEYLGFATITEDFSLDLKRVLINNSSKEIQVGDRLLTREESSIGSTIFPSPPDATVDGLIIAFLDSGTMASQLDTVVINVGLEDQLEVGNILSIRQEGPQILDEIERESMSFRQRVGNFFSPKQLQLPGKEIGTLLVYKTFEQLSYALILSSLEPAQLYNHVGNP